ncbi:MAG: uroporphyrinogen decarboxylase family protein, partial [Bacteroidota bacterium]
MLHRVDIRYPISEVELNRKRLEAAYRFEYFDRAPVLLGIEARYLLKERGVTFAEYFSDVKTQLIYQIENIKWRIENIPDDWFTKPLIEVWPDFQNVTNSSGCGCEIFWQEDETPQAVPCISTFDEMVKHQLPDWRGTLWGKRLEWYFEMKKLAEDIEVRLNGERIPIQVNVGINGDSPFMAAVDMAGSNFYVWLHEAPEECKRLLKNITDRYIEVETEYRKVSKKPMKDGLGYSDDSAQVISLDSYREFCVPVAKRLYDTFGCDRHDGRSMHLCGRNVHLHGALLNDLNITMLSGYGSENKPEEMMTLAGKVLLHGNISPLNLYQGTANEVDEETMHLSEVLAPYSGIILGYGY